MQLVEARPPPSLRHALIPALYLITFSNKFAHAGFNPILPMLISAVPDNQRSCQRRMRRRSVMLKRGQFGRSCGKDFENPTISSPRALPAALHMSGAKRIGAIPFPRLRNGVFTDTCCERAERSNGPRAPSRLFAALSEEVDLKQYRRGVGGHISTLRAGDLERISVNTVPG